MAPVRGPKGQGEGAAAKGPQAMLDQHLYLTPQDIAHAYVTMSWVGGEKEEMVWCEAWDVRSGVG